MNVWKALAAVNTSVPTIQEVLCAHASQGSLGQEIPVWVREILLLFLISNN